MLDRREGREGEREGEREGGRGGRERKWRSGGEGNQLTVKKGIRSYVRTVVCAISESNDGQEPG